MDVTENRLIDTMRSFPGKINITFFILFFQIFISIGSPDNHKDENPSDSISRTLMISLEYGSDKTFLGRSAGEKQTYISPYIYYEAPSGFFTSIWRYRILSPYNRWDETDLTAGWELILSKKIHLFLSYKHRRFNEESRLLQAGLNNNLEFLFERRSKIIQMKLYLDYDFGKSKLPNDYSVTGELGHEFIFENLLTKNKDAFRINPSAAVTAGTLNFYRFHIKNLKERPSLQNLSYEVNTKFTWTGIELALPLQYDIGRFSIEASPHYSIPLNQPKVFDSTPYFYVTSSLSFFII
jgi:hypothetical protein